MLTESTKVSLQLAKTLWFNTYRGQVTDDLGEFLASLRIIPVIPLDREEVPEDAPEVKPYILVLVENAAPLEPSDLVVFETKVSDALLLRLKKDGFLPEYCSFFYPTPPQLYDHMVEHE